MESSTESIFTHIVKSKLWSDQETPCGPGSYVANAMPIIQALPQWFGRHQIASIADFGCGDFNWLRLVDLAGKSYDGYDVVKDLIEQARTKHGTASIRFHHADAFAINHAPVDIVICKDVFIHFPTGMVLQALHRIRKTGSSYLASNSYPGAHNENRRVQVGDWDCIDLEAAPFHLGCPLERIDVSEPGFPRKLFCLWRLN